MGKSKSGMGKKNGGWFNLCFLGNCMSSRSRVDSSASRPTNTQHDAKGFSDANTDPPVALVLSTSATSNLERTLPTPSRGDELKIASQLKKFTYNELKAVTRNFRPECLLGEGGFGSVYKGWINENGCTPVRPGSGLPAAVKTLNQNGLQGHQEWLAEVNYLGELQHPHLVKLIGYCMEDDQRLLVYEFMPRGSLENHLFKRSLPLPWCIRMKIVLGAAMGLAFLHEEAERPVIYRDFKASNILLDAEYNAKLSDFGLAKDGPEGDKTHVSTRVMGTYGYAAPEYVMTGHLTSRSDVYSFGVVLLEMLSGRRSMDKSKRNGEHNLVEWARPFLSDRRRFYRVIDPRLEGRFSVKGAQKSVELAASCLSRDPKARPLMSEVVETLKPLPRMKDLACDSPYFHVMKSKSAGVKPNARNSTRLEAGLALQKRRPARSFSLPNGHLTSPYNNTPNHISPKPHS